MLAQVLPFQPRRFPVLMSSSRPSIGFAASSREAVRLLKSAVPESVRGLIRGVDMRIAGDGFQWVPVVESGFFEALNPAVGA